MVKSVEFFRNKMKIKLVAIFSYFLETVLVFVCFLCQNFSLYSVFSFLDHYNSSSSFPKTKTNNSSSRNENHTGCVLLDAGVVGNCSQ